MKTKKLLFLMCTLCALFFVACSQEVSDDDKEESRTKQTEEASDEEESKEDSDIVEEPDITEEAPALTEYNWQGTQDGSLLVFEEDGTFRYYRSAEDLTDSYYEGTYVFHVGEDAITYITTTLGQYGVTEEELVGIFDNNEEYEESNFVCFSLNNEACMIGGENTIDAPYETPYMGFCLEEEGSLYLDIANMNTANYHLFVAK